MVETQIVPLDEGCGMDFFHFETMDARHHIPRVAKFCRKW
jgi:hypothetical protein